MSDQNLTSILEILADEAFPPASVNLWSGIQDHFNAFPRQRPRPAVRSWRFTFLSSTLLRRLGWALVLLLALIATGTFLLAQPQPVSAQEIMRRVQLAATNWVAGGIESFEMVSETTTAADVPGAIPGQAEQSGQIHSRLHTWFQAPDRWRYESLFLILPGRELVSTPAVTVTDGRSVWSYDPQMNLLQIHDGNLSGPGKGGGISLYGAASGLDELMETAGECFSPTLVGQGEIVAGRKTYQIELGPSRCPRVAAAAINGSQTLWIDQETHFILKWETWDLSDRRVIRVMEVTEIRYNTPLSADLFTFTPPPGTRVLDERAGIQAGSKSTPIPSPTSADAPTPNIHRQLSTTPTPQLSFDLLLPAWLPEEMTSSVQVDGKFVTLSFDPRPNDAPHSVLTLLEMPAALILPGGDPGPQATREHIGEYDVTIIWRGQDCITFEWNMGDLHLQLTNPYDPPGQPRYSCDQLRRIVESIR
jgi:outer membrane lipoprotein-sorting protein